MIRSRMRRRQAIVALWLCVLVADGCAYLEVPWIDPTGERIFAQPPIAASPGYQFDPGGQLPTDDVAVTLQPQVTVAPIGSEVVLVAGVQNRDGFLRTNRRLEWSLAPGGVGHFVDVGKNRAIDVLLGDFNCPRKVDNTFAIGSTSRDYLRLGRGTATTADDVCVKSGQGWITLTSAIEGTSHVTVFAPGVPLWDGRTRTGTIHWVDAQWSFPPPAINPAGTTHVMTTTVVRQSDRLACTGWLVRYEIVGGPAVGFAPDGAQAIEVPTDAAGRASAEIIQQQPEPGTNQIAIQVIRPAGLGSPNGRRLVVGSGSTLKTWTAPALAVRKTAPGVGEVGATLCYRIEVSNPGDQPAEGVVLTDVLPGELSYLNSNPPAEVDGQTLRWQLGQLPAGRCRLIELNCSAVQAGAVTNTASAIAAGGLQDSHGATTTVTAPRVDVKLSGPAEATVGSEITFHAVVTNFGQAPLTGLLITDRFDPGLEHAAAPSPIERELPDMAPGQSLPVDVTFRVTKTGRLYHTVEVTSAGGICGSAQACVLATEAAAAEAVGPTPVPSPPAADTSITIEKSVISGRPAPQGGPPVHVVGEMARFTIAVTNTGTQTLSNLKVQDYYDANLDPRLVTDGFKFEGYDLIYRIGSLPPGKTEKLEVVCRCLAPTRLARNRAVVTSDDGARAQDEAVLEIRAAEAGPAVAPGDPAVAPGDPAVAPGDLTMTVSDLTDPVAAGTALTYEILVANQGQASHRQIAVVATIPAEMTLVRLGTTGPGPTKWAAEGQVVRFAPVPEIPPGQTLVYRVRVRAKAAGTLTFRAELSGQTVAQPIAREETTVVF